MPTYLPPIALPDVQRYLKDVSTDGNVILLLTEAIHTATERVYTYLDRDYTPNAVKTDSFFGDDRAYHFLRHPCGAITSWKYYDTGGAETDVGAVFLKLFSNGKLIVTKEKKFLSGYEHRVSYTTPASLSCPEMVKQVIIEIAAGIFEASKQGAGELQDEEMMTQRHEYLLAPYRRIPV